MVDLGGNFNGYMNDMSRVFSIGKLPEEAYTAHQVCLDIQEKIASIARPGIACEVLYDTAVEVVKAAGFADKFMGTGQQAKFIGHGIGLEINEAPVLATIRTGYGLCPRTENRYSECRSRRYRELLGSDQRRNRKTDELQ